MDQDASLVAIITTTTTIATIVVVGGGCECYEGPGVVAEDGWEERGKHGGVVQLQSDEALGEVGQRRRRGLPRGTSACVPLVEDWRSVVRVQCVRLCVNDNGAN